MKEKLFKISKALLIAVGLIELAISQVHIEMITKLFTSYVGFYLFIFIISGMLIMFNLSSMKVDDSGKVKEFILATVAALASGGYFMVISFNDLATQESVIIEEISLSLICIGVGMAVYAIGTIAVLLSYGMKEKEERSI